MAIVAATETSFADEVETEPDLEHPELHLRRRGCRRPATNVKAYCDEGEWVCHTCGHQLSLRVASPLTLTTGKRGAARLPSRRLLLAASGRPEPSQPNDPARQRLINGRGLICDASGELVAHARRPASSAH